MRACERALVLSSLLRHHTDAPRTNSTGRKSRDAGALAQAGRAGWASLNVAHVAHVAVVVAVAHLDRIGRVVAHILCGATVWGTPEVTSASSGRPYDVAYHTFDLVVVRLGVLHEHRRGLAVQRVARVRVAQELRDEQVEDVDEVCRAPRGCQ